MGNGSGASCETVIMSDELRVELPSNRVIKANYNQHAHAENIGYWHYICGQIIAIRFLCTAHIIS